MNDREKIESLELKVKLLETQLELERLINTPTERIVYPQYPYIEPFPYYPYYPTYPYPPFTWTDSSGTTATITYNF